MRATRGSGSQPDPPIAAWMPTLDQLPLIAMRFTRCAWAVFGEVGNEFPS